MLMASGQLMLEVYERFANTLVLEKVKRLPLPDQKYFADGGTVEVVVRRDGRTEAKQCDPLKLARLEIDQVFGPTGRRDQAEQVSWLDSREKKRPKTAVYENEIFVKANHLIVRNGPNEIKISRQDVARFLAEMS